MPNLPTDKFELLDFRDILIEQRDAARAAGDTAKVEDLTKRINIAQEAIDRIALEGLQRLSAILNDLRLKLESLQQSVEDWPFGTAEAPADHERPFREDNLQDNDFEDQGPSSDAPETAPVPPGTVPVVSPGWSENYLQLWGTMEISDSWDRTARRICEKIIANQHRYAKAVDGTNVPWWFVCVVHAMECSLRFDQHLHNGDPLTGRTKRVPRDRPASGVPPFSWEESARDALEHDRLLGVTDWSLANVLFHWHRYNGINNAYKRNGIPTPYLWSGTQHYRKGKYVADGKFDPNAVSKQVGAAVLLKTLVNLGAVSIETGGSISANPEAASGSTETVDLPLAGPEFAHVKKELDYPGNLAAGDGGSGSSQARKSKVKQVQEWLTIHNFDTGIDGDFGSSTEKQLKRFQMASGRVATGVLDEETWVLLTLPMRRALAKTDHDGALFEDAVVRIAHQHIQQRPEEVGGNNRGPWVRLYMRGKQGSAQKWCAGFVCFVVAQAARDLNRSMPFRRQVGVDQLVGDAKSDERFIRGTTLSDEQKRRSALRPGFLFVNRRTSTDWTHVGIIFEVDGADFDTLEGNTDNAGGVDGANAKIGNRSYTRKDFLKLL